MNAHVTPPGNPAQVDIGLRIEQFVKCRNKIAEIKDRHKEELKNYNVLLEMLEGELLKHLNAVNLDSVKGAAGTAYRKIKRSATIADPALFRAFVIGAESWDTVDWKANAPAIHDYIQTHQAPPPGVNYSEAFEVGVRKK